MTDTVPPSSGRRPRRGPRNRPSGAPNGKGPLIPLPATADPIEGILDLTSQGHGFIRRDANWVASRGDLFVPSAMVRQFGLRTGHRLSATWKPPSKGQQSPSVGQILTVEGISVDDAPQWQHFDQMTAESPTRRVRLERGPDDFSGRMIDLFVPLGLGQRGLIIAQPMAGKTTLLKNIARSIAERNPETERFILLVDERPEEVTDFRRAEVGQVIGSSFDSGIENHLKNAELLLQRAQRLVEMGKDVVMLVDSLTRLARASNLTSRGGRTGTGGLDTMALQFPRKLFGAARATDTGGSLTILATVLVDTGSRLDDVVYEEFKGTGNWELRLDRKLAEARLFPAIDIPASGTRREELLFSPVELAAAGSLRRFLRSHSGDKQDQLDMLLKWLNKFPSNQAIMDAMAQLQKSSG